MYLRYMYLRKTLTVSCHYYYLLSFEDFKMYMYSCFNTSIHYTSSCIFKFRVQCVPNSTSVFVPPSPITFPITANLSEAQIGFEHRIASNTSCQISNNQTAEIRLCNFTHSTGALDQVLSVTLSKTLCLSSSVVWLCLA